MLMRPWDSVTEIETETKTETNQVLPNRDKTNETEIETIVVKCINNNIVVNRTTL